MAFLMWILLVLVPDAFSVIMDVMMFSTMLLRG